MNYLFYLVPAILMLLFFSCTYNFEYGSSLANFQEKKYNDYLDNVPLIKKEEKRLKKNMWVKMSECTAPSNLVIRHYCLIDLYKGKSFHRKRIGVQLEILGDEIWREGYSYWLFTKPLLVEYYKKFNRYGTFIENMDKKFQEISYLGKDGKLYPPPYGDIRHVSLEKDLQGNSSIQSNRDIYPLIIQVSSDTIEYFIQKCPIGFNTHVPLETQTVVVTKDSVYIKKDDGTHEPFEWYKGYDKKYEDKGAEFKDTFNWKRIKSLSPKKMWEIYIGTFYKSKVE